MLSQFSKVIQMFIVGLRYEQIVYGLEIIITIHLRCRHHRKIYLTYGY